MKKEITIKTKKFISLFVTLAMLFNIFCPSIIVYANNGYTITFQATDNHTVEEDNGHLKIDGQYVSLKNGENDIGTVSCQNETTCNISVNDNVGAGEITYNSNQFTLYNTNGHTAYNMGTQLSSNTVFLIEDYANNTQTSNLEIQFDSNDINNNVVNYNVDNTNVTLTINGTNINQGKVHINRNDLGSVTFTIGNTFDAETMQVIVRGANEFNTVLNVTNNTASLNGLNLPDGPLHLNIEMKNNNNNQEPQNNDYNDINVNATFNNTAGLVIINDHSSEEGSSINDVLENAGYTENTKTNHITIITSFGENVASKVTINNIEYDYDESGYDVAGASTYTIVVEGDSSVVTPKTIIWTNADYSPKDEEDAAWTSQFNIEHGYAKVIAVYDQDNNLLNPNQYVNENSDNYGLHDGFGWVSIIPGSRVIFEFIPEYGYQLTGITINEQPLSATQTMNRFEFYMPNGSGNVHFAATFTKTEDIVKANSNKVTSGNIDLGNPLESGSAQLTVNDIELSSAKIKDFQNAAGEYEISNYLDINLYNVFYKGKNDSNDVWSNQIDELEKEATISIKLETGINANDIVIVHNVHNGETFEIIEIDSYDETTNTITFKTKSFSNYAIATKSSNIKINTADNSKENQNAKELVTNIINNIAQNKDVKGINEDLKNAIKDAIESGKTITVDVEKNNITENTIKEDAEKIKTLIGNDFKVVQYFDITIKISIDGTYKGNVTLLDNQLALTFNIPDNLPEVKNGYKRTFTVVRVHDGIAEKLDTTQNNDKTITSKSDKFSTYAITYTDTKIESNNPKTGDNIILYFVTLIISISGLISSCIILNKRKKLTNK